MERKVSNMDTSTILQEIDVLPNYRYERKFTARDVERLGLLQNIKHHPAFFQEIYAPRQINNIYFDTLEMAFYKANRIGVSKRKKIRIRWYGETFGRVLKPKLEYKLKDNLIGDKWTFDLPDFDWNEQTTWEDIKHLLQSANLPQPILADIQNTRPTLLNSYQRTYFMSASKKFRLTFDEELNYHVIKYLPSSFGQFFHDKGAFVVELKYAPEFDKEVHFITSKLPYRLDKSSKYVNGMDRW